MPTTGQPIARAEGQPAPKPLRAELLKPDADQAAYLQRLHRVYPKREFRAVWVATVMNIDWPKRSTFSSAEQQDSFRKLLDEQKALGMNAVIVQIRPAADAFYPSYYEPWSQWLTGKQGQAPEPYYDPLAFMVAEAHARGMEFHAWVNPFRAVTNTQTADISRQHITKTRPGWFLTYGNLKIFNPGIPAVRQYLVKVILDVVARYDVDGIHFDDYFYPYPDGQNELAD